MIYSGDNNLTTEGVKVLKGQMDSLECLNLGSNRLDDGSVAALNDINPKGIYYLKLCTCKMMQLRTRSLKMACKD